MPKFIDLTGQKFGRLTVIERVEKPERLKSRGTYYLCKCECGKTTIVQRSNLGKGCISCGCIKKENCKKFFTGKAPVCKKEYGVSSGNRLYNRYRLQAKYRNIPFLLKKEEFFNLTTLYCYYCGKKPSQAMIGRRGVTNGEYIYNGIDRKDSNLGYTLENCVPCCGRCNEAKMSENKEDFLLWVEQVHNHQAQKREEQIEWMI